MERLVTGAGTRMQRRVAEAGVWHGGGDRNAAEFVARTTGTTRAQAKASLDTSRRLGQLEQVDAAIAAGELSAEQATAVADAAAADPGAQERLLEAAAKVSVSELREEARRVKAAADPDPETTRRRIHDRRFLRRWNDSEGAYNLALRNTAEVGAEVDALLQPFLDRVWRTARVQGRRESPDAYAADALLEALRGYDPAAEHDPAVQTAAAAGPQAGAQGWQARPDAQGGSGAQATRANQQGGEGMRAEPATTESGRTAADDGGRAAAGEAGQAAADDVGRTADGEGGRAAAGEAGQAAADDVGRTADGEGGRVADGDGEGGGVGLWEPSTAPARSRLPGGSPVAETGDLPPSRGVMTDPGPGWEPWEPWQEGEPMGEPPLAWDGDQELGEPDIDATLACFAPLPPLTLVPYDDEEPLPEQPPAGWTPPAPRRARARTRARETKVLATVDLAALRRGHLEGGETCEIAGAGPVPLATVKALLGEAFLALVLRDGVDVVNVTHLGRQVTAHQRTALEARGYRCEVPGCPARHHLEIDHVTGWEATRRTRLDELAWLCSHHHGCKTHRGWTLHGPPGDRRWVNPDDDVVAGSRDPTRAA